MDKSQKSAGVKSDIQIKMEPGNAVKTERLTSFKMPRDLTLGAGRTLKPNPNKKVYTPNLNVGRTKSSDVQTSRDTTARGRGSKSTRGAGRGAKADKRGGSNVVQTSGVFSEGIAGNLMKRAYSGGGGSTRESSAEVLRRPALIKRDFVKLDPDEELQQIREILGDDDEKDKAELLSLDSDNMPIKLIDPTKARIKLELKKVEPILNGALKSDETDVDYKPESEVKPDAANSSEYPLSLTELFSRTHMQMVLVQLPDCLPGRGPEKEMAPPPSRPSTSNTALKSNEEIIDPPETLKPTAESNKCCLGHLQEGQIGKIVRYRSGRTKMILGDTHYELALGMEAGFLQDLMAIETNREQRNGDMVKLGEVNAKINATPDWEHLFSKATT